MDVYVIYTNFPSALLRLCFVLGKEWGTVPTAPPTMALNTCSITTNSNITTKQMSEEYNNNNN